MSKRATAIALHSRLLVRFSRAVLLALSPGHYVSLCKVSNQWVCYDDDDLHLWTVEDVKTVYGSVHTGEKNGHLDGYLLFYSVVAE